MLTVYLKPSNYCNIGCDHCYLTVETRADRSRMSEDTLRKTAAMLSEMQTMQRKDRSHIIWHGGEPMVLKPDWFWNAGRLLDELLPGHTESFQTSLIPYKHDYAPLILERYNGIVGSSIDFSARMMKGSPEEYQKFWMKKVDMAREDGIRVIPGIVPAKREMGRAAELIDWMASHGFTRFRMERYNSYGFLSLERPSNKEHSQFLIDMFNAVMKRMVEKDEVISVITIEAAIRGVLFGLPGDRWGGTCQADFLVVEPDGSLNNCPDKASREMPYSNVHDGLMKFVASPERRKWIRIQHAGHQNDYCSSCEFNGFCKSYCPITPHERSECAGNKSFLLYVKNYVSTEEGAAMARRYISGADSYYSSNEAYLS